MIGICQDLTDIRGAERARIELDERFRSIFERAPVGIALVARGGRFTLVNEALAEFLGRDRDALEGMRRRGRHAPRGHAGERRGACGRWPPASSPSGTRRSATCARTARSAGARCGRCCCTTRTGATRTAWRCCATSPSSGVAERRRAAAHGVLRVMAGGARPARRAAGAAADRRRGARLGAREPVARRGRARGGLAARQRARAAGGRPGRSRSERRSACSCSTATARPRGPRSSARSSASSSSAAAPRSSGSTRRCTTR